MRVAGGDATRCSCRRSDRRTVSGRTGASAAARTAPRRLPWRHSASPSCPASARVRGRGIVPGRPGEALHFVAEEHRDGPLGDPVIQVDGVWRELYGGELAASGGKRVHPRGQIVHPGPGHAVLGTQRSLGNLLARRTRCNSRKNQLTDAGAVGRPEERSDVVKTAYLVEHDGDRQGAHVLKRKACRCLRRGATMAPIQP